MKNSIYITFTWIILVSLGCQSVANQTNLNRQCSNLIKPPFPAKSVRLQHIDVALKTGDQVIRGQTAGTISPYPNPISAKYQKEYEKATMAYSAQNFPVALTILTMLIQNEPVNAFFWNLYGKTLYALKMYDKSLATYEKLLTIIDALDTNNSDGSINIVIDFWFLEAYWKLGTLYLDKGSYQKAYVNIRKILDVVYLANGILKPSDRNFVISALGYLTETTFFLKNRNENLFFYCETLKIHPENSYVKKFQIP